MFVKPKEESVKTRRTDRSALEMLSEAQTEGEVSERQFFYFFLQSDKSESCILINFH